MLKKYSKKAVGLVKKLLGLNKQHMLDLNKCVKKFNMKIHGAIIVGAHHFREEKEYTGLGVRHFILIEPLPSAMNILIQKYADKPGFQLVYCACGASHSEAILFAETANAGQSSSLLRPKEHTKHYPDIEFNHRVKVPVRRLDNMIGGYHGQFNFMSLDVQGYELEVLKGATRQLPYVDYILAEVNKSSTEMYESCTTIDKLDYFLAGHGFKRVTEPHWVKNSYADALYIKNHLV